MNGLTKRQRECHDFIRSFTLKHGFAPTLREIGAYMGIRSTNGVNDHLRALERKGWIVRDDMKSRTTRVIGEPDECPLCGQHLKRAAS